MKKSQFLASTEIKEVVDSLEDLIVEDPERIWSCPSPKKLLSSNLLISPGKRAAVQQELTLTGNELIPGILKAKSTHVQKYGTVPTVDDFELIVK